MISLRTVNNTAITKDVLFALEKSGIKTVNEFLKTDTLKLSHCAGITIATTESCKEYFRLTYKPKTQDFADYYLCDWSRRLIYGTGLKSLDDLFASYPFAGGSVWEICGRSGVGKSLFCHNVLVNFVIKHKMSALYIDTKLDFSGSQIRAILRARALEANDCGQVMQRIKVVSALKAAEVITALQTILNHLKQSSVSSYCHPKLIVIDSVPAVVLNYSRKGDRFKSKCMLGQMGKLIQELSSKYHIAFLLVNLTVMHEPIQWTNNSNADSDDELDVNASPSVAANRDHEKCLYFGGCWSIVPHVCLSIETEANANSLQRQVRVLKSCYSDINVTCTFLIGEGTGDMV